MSNTKSYTYRSYTQQSWLPNIYKYKPGWHSVPLLKCYEHICFPGWCLLKALGRRVWMCLGSLARCWWYCKRVEFVLTGLHVHRWSEIYVLVLLIWDCKRDIMHYSIICRWQATRTSRNIYQLNFIHVNTHFLNFLVNLDSRALTFGKRPRFSCLPGGQPQYSQLRPFTTSYCSHSLQMVQPPRTMPLLSTFITFWPVAEGWGRYIK